MPHLQFGLYLISSLLALVLLTSAGLPLAETKAPIEASASVNPPVDQSKQKKDKKLKKKRDRIKKRNQTKNGKAFSIVALVTGILSLTAAIVIMFSHIILAAKCISGCSYGFGMLIAPIIALVLGIVAIVMGVLGKSEEDGIRGAAITGFVLGVVGLSFAFIFWLIYLLVAFL